MVCYMNYALKWATTAIKKRIGNEKWGTKERGGKEERNKERKSTLSANVANNKAPSRWWGCQMRIWKRNSPEQLSSCQLFVNYPFTSFGLSLSLSLALFYKPYTSFFCAQVASNRWLVLRRSYTCDCTVSFLPLETQQKKSWRKRTREKERKKWREREKEIMMLCIWEREREKDRIGSSASLTSAMDSIHTSPCIECCVSNRMKVNGVRVLEQRRSELDMLEQMKLNGSGN